MCTRVCVSVCVSVCQNYKEKTKASTTGESGFTKEQLELLPVLEEIEHTLSDSMLNNVKSVENISTKVDCLLPHPNPNNKGSIEFQHKRG